MAHAAKIDSEGFVRQVLVVDDENFKDAQGNLLGQKLGSFPQDELLIEYMASIGLHDPELKDAGEWRFTSYNNNFRGTYAGIGFTYDKLADVFAEPKTPEEEES